MRRLDFGNTVRIHRECATLALIHETRNDFPRYLFKYRLTRQIVFRKPVHHCGERPALAFHSRNYRMPFRESAPYPPTRCAGSAFPRQNIMSQRETKDRRRVYRVIARKRYFSFAELRLWEIRNKALLIGWSLLVWRVNVLCELAYPLVARMRRKAGISYRSPFPMSLDELRCFVTHKRRYCSFMSLSGAISLSDNICLRPQCDW